MSHGGEVPLEDRHKLVVGTARQHLGDEAPTRTNTPLVTWDEVNGLVKVNPVAAWTFDQLVQYSDDNLLPVNPLLSQGYPSIGCQPCTRKVAPGDDPRAGRWAGTDKTECGLHV